MDVALALHPGRGDAPARAVLLGVFGEPEPERGPEIDAVLHLRREDVDMVKPLRMAALVVAVALQQALAALLHREAELEGHAERVGGLQRPALARHVGEVVRQPLAAEEGGGALQVRVARHLEAERLAAGLVRPAQDEGMVLALLDAAQVEGVRRLGFDVEAEGIVVERAGTGEVRHPEHDVARAHDHEGRIGDGSGDGHGAPFSAVKCPAGAPCACPWRG